MKLAIITTHPIQYYAPVFGLLHQRGIIIKVFYTSGTTPDKLYDPGFKRFVQWDIPLLVDYPYEFLENTSKIAGTTHFDSIVNPTLIDKINLFNADRLLVYGWSYRSHLQVLRYFKDKIPIYFRGDSNLLDQIKGAKAALRYCFLRWVYQHIDYAFYVGQNNMDYYRKFGLKENQLIFSPHAIEIERFVADQGNMPGQIKKELNIEREHLLILFAGKFEKKKDPFLLLRAVVFMNRPDVHLLFVGNGDLELGLKDEAKGNLNIHFMDFQNQSFMPAIYQACDLFCLPSIGPGETWGLSVNEAMASKKPVVVSDKVGCARDLVKPGSNGCIFKAGESADLVKQLKKLIEDGKPALKKMGESSYHIIQNWSIQNQVEAMERSFYEK